ncbi:DnaA ATPase domain-containing protein [Mesoplasma corruscae]|uniref:Primosomal protein DnaI n=1 Tax=Mesoplasma corruscae TaxID=216874 RepID=A0A2S5RHI1_9MOLU|nr:DnaA/Hda family protein [Mesoplasma corruscae]PPE06760.1 primosomal protein DnaI [Mesoplasma corruscae]
MEKLVSFLNSNDSFLRIKKEFENSNYPINDEVIKTNQNILEEFASQYILCTAGPLINCQQLIKGMQSNLSYRDEKFYITYFNCAHFIFENRNHLIKSNYSYVDFDVDLFPQTVKGYLKGLSENKIFDENEKLERKRLIENAGLVIVKYLEDKVNNYKKGYYIWGNLGIGKTNLLRALANEACLRGGNVVFCTAPNIIENAKEQFSEKDSKNVMLIKNLKKCDVLFIDDFAGEMVSLWSRDNFWFSIFNYRMDHQKLTFFTSNFSSVDLNNIYTIKSQPKTTEKKKVDRFIERIKAISSSYNLKGEKSKRNLV